MKSSAVDPLAGAHAFLRERIRRERFAARHPMSAALVTFNFHGDALEVIPGEGTVHVSIRRVCDALGVDFSRQLRKLKDDPAICVDMMSMQMPGDDQRREIACIELRSLPLWLATIHPRKVNADIREKLIRYRREAAEVLADHFLGRRAPPPAAPQRGTVELLALGQRVMALEEKVSQRLDVIDTRLQAMAEDQSLVRCAQITKARSAAQPPMLGQGTVVERVRALLAYLAVPGRTPEEVAMARERRAALTLEARLFGALSTKANLYELVTVLARAPGALDALEAFLARAEEKSAAA